jgi:hypothetical protein
VTPKEQLDALIARWEREHRSARPEEWVRARALWEAWVRDDQAYWADLAAGRVQVAETTPHTLAISGPPKSPPDWERLEAKYGVSPGGQRSPVESTQQRGPEPKPIPRRAFHEASDLLGTSMSKRKIAEQTGLTRRDVDKIEAWRNGTGFEPKPGPTPSTVILRPVK